MPALDSLIVHGVRLYQRKASPALRSACRFEPTCSEYMIAAVGRYGSVRGVSRGLWRICRCRPPNGGVDLP